MRRIIGSLSVFLTVICATRACRLGHCSPLGASGSLLIFVNLKKLAHGQFELSFCFLRSDGGLGDVQGPGGAAQGLYTLMLLDICLSMPQPHESGHRMICGPNFDLSSTLQPVRRVPSLLINIATIQSLEASLTRFESHPSNHHHLPQILTALLEIAVTHRTFQTARLREKLNSALGEVLVYRVRVRARARARVRVRVRVGVRGKDRRLKDPSDDTLPSYPT